MTKKDPRIKKLAKIVVKSSLDVKPGERVFIDSSIVAQDFINECCKQIILKGATPVLNIYPKNYKKRMINSFSEKQLKLLYKKLLNLARKTNAVIDVENEASNLSKIPKKRFKIYNSITQSYWDFLVYKKGNYKRLTILVPAKREARNAKMPETKFADYLYRCCFLNWPKLSKKFKKINRIFDRGEEVRLIGKNINLKFSIKGRNSILEAGKENMPSGEIFMAPIKTSLNGWARFEYPAIRDGLEIAGIFLEFKKGKVIKFSAEKNEKLLKSLLETDKGARYVGEFGIGINPRVNKITNSWIDEKMPGTVHLALGRSYEENNGDNDSAIHWDIVKDMKKAKIILDGKVIQDMGKWRV